MARIYASFPVHTPYEEVMRMLGKILIFLALLLVAAIVFVLYCCLVVASREDQRLEGYGIGAEPKDSEQEPSTK